MGRMSGMKSTARAALLLACLAAGVAAAQQEPAPYTRDELRVFVDRMANGDLDAYHAIGAAMLRGDRLNRDVEGGLEKLGHAADRGHVHSLLLLANWHHYARDLDRARSYLQRALATGDPAAHWGFVTLLDGMQLWGLFPDEADRKRRRLESLERAANGNIPDAMEKLAWHYESAATKDPVRAFYWFEQAAMHGHHNAIINLSRLLAESSDKQDASFEKVAARNPAAAAWLRFELGTTYEAGSGEESTRLAAKHYELTAADEQADPRLRQLAQLRYARIVVELGNADERASALAYLNAAAAAGSVHAQCFLATELADDGMLPVDAGTAARWEKTLRAALSEDTIDTVCGEMYGD